MYCAREVTLLSLSKPTLCPLSNPRHSILRTNDCSILTELDTEASLLLFRSFCFDT